MARFNHIKDYSSDPDNDPDKQRMPFDDDDDEELTDADLDAFNRSQGYHPTSPRKTTPPRRVPANAPVNKTPVNQGNKPTDKYQPHTNEQVDYHQEDAAFDQLSADDPESTDLFTDKKPEPPKEPEVDTKAKEVKDLASRQDTIENLKKQTQARKQVKSKISSTLKGAIFFFVLAIIAGFFYFPNSSLVNHFVQTKWSQAVQATKGMFSKDSRDYVVDTLKENVNFKVGDENQQANEKAIAANAHYFTGMKTIKGTKGNAAENTLPAGYYRIGTQTPQGLYRIKQGTYTIYKNDIALQAPSDHTADVKKVKATKQDYQYLTYGMVIHLADSTMVNTRYLTPAYLKQGAITEGTKYLIGVDIPAGSYKVSSKNGSSSQLQVTKDGVTTNTAVGSQTYLKLLKGTVVVLNGAELKL